MLHAPRAVAGIEDAELAVLVSQAIAALPDDGSWIPLATWRKAFRRVQGRRTRGRRRSPTRSPSRSSRPCSSATWSSASGGKVRRRGRHFVPAEHRRAARPGARVLRAVRQGLLDKLALADIDTGTYLRNHYLNIDAARLPEFQQRLDAAMRALAEEFASDASEHTASSTS